MNVYYVMMVYRICNPRGVDSILNRGGGAGSSVTDIICHGIGLTDLPNPGALNPQLHSHTYILKLFNLFSYHKHSLLFHS